MSLLVIISPAKTQNFAAEKIAYPASNLRFPQESQTLIGQLRKLSSEQLQKLMGISQDLAEQNMGRFQNYKTNATENTKQALYAFEGDVYKSLDKATYNKPTLSFAQNHLRIISGLYGLLRPMDAIQAYRLEMKTPLPTSAGKNLYQFWGSKITDLIAEDIATVNATHLINLASVEYSKAIQLKKLSVTSITPQFKEFKKGKLRTIAIFAKQARGAMANHIIINKIKNTEKLKSYTLNGYTFSPENSTETEWVYVR